MAKIKIKDLPKDVKITKEEMRKVFGGPVGFSARIVAGGSETLRQGVMINGSCLQGMVIDGSSNLGGEEYGLQSRIQGEYHLGGEEI